MASPFHLPGAPFGQGFEPGAGGYGPPSPQTIIDDEHLRLLRIGYFISAGQTAIFIPFGLLYAVMGLRCSAPHGRRSGSHAAFHVLDLRDPRYGDDGVGHLGNGPQASDGDSPQAAPLTRPLHGHGRPVLHRDPVRHGARPHDAERSRPSERAPAIRAIDRLVPLHAGIRSGPRSERQIRKPCRDGFRLLGAGPEAARSDPTRRSRARRARPA